MKKVLYNNYLLLFIVGMSITVTSCLKDKRWEEGEYGAIRNTDGRQYITIPKAKNAVNAMGLESKNAAQDVELFALSYDFASPAASAITATVRVNNDLVGAADPDALVLPATAYTIPSTTLTVEAGQRISDVLSLSVVTGDLDPTKKYGIGFSLESVSGSGIEIPANLKNVVFIFTIKNKFDGIYTLRSRMDHPADRDPAWTRTPFTYGYDIHLVTKGPYTVDWINTAFSGGVGYHPLMTPGTSGFGATLPVFVFDENNKLVSVTNGVPNPSNGRAFAINPAVTDSRYDPDTKTIYAAFIMTQPGFEPIPIYDTLTFKSKRP